MRVAVPVGIAAAVVQVIGLLRWPLLVPGFAADASSPDPAAAAAARDSFVLAHRILGNLIGETLGYLLTAAWTLLVLVALGRSFAGLWFIALGAVSAVLVLAGVLSPLDLPVIDLANFIGYVLWSLWLVVFGLLLLRRPRTGTAAPAEYAPPQKGNDRHATTLDVQPARIGFVADLDRRLRVLPDRWCCGWADRRPRGRSAGRADRGPSHGCRHRCRAVAGQPGPAPSRALDFRHCRGMGLGLLLGASVVEFGTSLADLVVTGALTGLLLGVAQTLALPAATRYRWVWAAAVPLLWALGWTVTTLVGVAVEEQFSVFGAAGAVTFSALSGVLLNVLLPVRASNAPVDADSAAAAMKDNA